MTDTARSVVIASLAIGAVAFAASTLEATVVPESGGASGPDGSSGAGGGGILPVPQAGSTPGETVQLPIPTELLALLTVIVVLAVVAYVGIYWRESLGTALAGIALVGLGVLLIQLVSSPAQPPGGPVIAPDNGSVVGGAGSGGDAGTTPVVPPALLLVLGVGVALVGAVGALRRLTPGDDDTAATETDDDTAEAAAVGRAAGRAADRLEAEATAAVDNEVYRSWQEMTELLDVDDPDTSTPGEFATAAVEAGLGRDDVSELTQLFEEVRYGAQDASDDRERRAITVFRRIEERYAEADA